MVLRRRPGWEALVFAGIALAALGLRLWELDGRAMHYDESLHVHYAWRMATGEGYSHSPWMHGPFQVHLTALMFKLFSDTDFVARLSYALFGSALVALPYFLRNHLGRSGAIATAVLLALSPSMLYFSRFGRNEIIMAFWAVALLIVMWRYLHEGKRRYLYIASAILALMFATKETSYIIVAIFGGALFLISVPELVSWVLGRTRLSKFSEAPVFLILLITLTLPLWTAMASLFQDTVLFSSNSLEFQSDLDDDVLPPGLPGEFVANLKGRPGIGLSEDATVSTQETGRRWLITDPQQTFDIRQEESRLRVYRDGKALGGLEIELKADLESGVIPETLMSHLRVRSVFLHDAAAVSTQEQGRRWLITDPERTYTIRMEENWLNVYEGNARGIVLARTIGGAGLTGLPIHGDPFVSFPLVKLSLVFDALIIAGIVILPLGAALFIRAARRRAKVLLPIAAVVALTYAMVSFPEGVVARNYLIAFGALFAALVASIIIGLLWNWKVWLVCAGIFYLIWAALHTSMFGAFVQNHGACPGEVGNAFGTMCSKLGGVFTGSWQGLGYWVAQQDVSRGGQPWYYHFMIGSVYEFLPLLFGTVALVYYVRKLDLFGMMLGLWAVLTLLAYTLAGEKMPWLIVNVALPFIILTGKFIGDLFDSVRWDRLLRSASAALLILAPLLLLACTYLLWRSLNQGGVDSWQSWGLLASIAVMGGVSAYLIVRARPRVGMAVAGLGIAALLLGFSSFVAFQASYTYDDSRIEMLFYAQGSADIPRTAATLNEDIIHGGADGSRMVDVDYELWYPLNWYVRREQRDGTLGFQCYKTEDEDGYASWCNPLKEPPATGAILLNEAHARRDLTYLDSYEESGPFQNLLWFPESYRRPGENRKEESLGKQIKEDFKFAKENITRLRPWRDALDYFLFHRLGTGWWDSKYFTYTAPASVPGPET